MQINVQIYDRHDSVRPILSTVFRLYFSLWLLAILFLISVRLQAQTYTGDLTLRTQAEVNAFNYTEMTGDLKIEGDDITSLQPLTNLTKIGGWLSIYENDNLANLAGLEHVTSIEGGLYIGVNRGLTSFGLERLVSVGGSFTIYANYNLRSLASMKNLTTVGGYIHINSNSSLISLTELQHITSVPGYVYIGSNDNLTNLELGNLVAVKGHFQITSNNRLNAVTLTNLASVAGMFMIRDNPQLAQCCQFLPGIRVATGAVTIAGNAANCSSVTEIEAACAPHISAQPHSVVICAGQPATFSLEATGPDLSYQWLREGQPIPGATSATYSIPGAVSSDDAGTYWVIVTGKYATLTFEKALLTVNQAPSIITHPLASTTCAGQTVHFSVAVTGTNITYQWQKNDNPIDGATAGTYEIDAANAQDAAVYSVNVRNNCGSVQSEKAALTVLAPLVLTLPVLQPVASEAGQCGAAVAFTATASDNAATALSYRIGQTTIVSPHVFPIGTTTITAVASTSCGEVTGTFSVVVEDKIPPVVALNPLTLYLDSSGQATLDVTSLNGQIRDNCHITSIVASKTIFQCPELGENIVTLTVKDGAGNLTVQTMAVTVLDTLRPTALARNITITLPASGHVVITAADIDKSSRDNCAIQSIAIDKTRFSTGHVGLNMVTLTVKDNSGNTATATATVTIQAPAARLSVLYQDADYNQPTNNTIRPYLQLLNEGTSPVPYGEITLRYWLTVENFSPMTNLSVYWAQLGTNKVKIKYVQLSQPHQGAFGYIEYSFETSAGSLAPGANSGPIQTGAGKADWTAFNEVDDYSYANSSRYTTNNKITIYQKGVLIAGIEPLSAPSVQSLKIYSQTKSSPVTNSVSTQIELRNEGNQPVGYQELKVRYYFTAEGNQPLNFYLDYAALGTATIKGAMNKLTQPVAGADSYLELSFTGLDRLFPRSSTGIIEYRIAKSDWSNFNQTNDHSYKAGGSLAENAKMVIYLNGTSVYGTEPTGATARLAAVEGPTAPNEAEGGPALDVTVLGNPVRGNTVELEIKGPAGQPLRLLLSDLQGRVVAEKQIIGQETAQRHHVSLAGQAPGVLVLRVSTPTLSKTLKIIKVD